MKFEVDVSDQAGKEAEQAYLWILKRSPQGAARWWAGLEAAIASLEDFPERCPLAPEDEYFPEEIRHLLYGRRQHRYRILFTIRGSTVQILHVRHGARKTLRPGDAEEQGP